MQVNKVTLVYFSPTGTSQKVLSAIAQGLGVDEVTNLDLTMPEDAARDIAPLGDELVILGAPVYGGRIPAEAIARFRRIKGDNTLAVPVVLYGNREFEDALLELKDLALELGCKPVAAGAFIGEHSFATEQLPIAMGRPDEDDLQKARDFGQKVKAKVAGLASPDDLADPEIPGRFPYQGGPMDLAAAPLTNEGLCILCGACATVCPVAAVTVDDAVVTDAGLCIRCCACVKNCPTGAKLWENPMMLKITNWLHKNCVFRKEPQVFGLEG